MAAKKTTSKSASAPKGIVKSALKPAKAVKPAQPAKAAKPAKPVTVAKPSTAVKAAKSPKVVTASKSAKAAKPGKSATAAKAAKPAPAKKAPAPKSVSVAPPAKKVELPVKPTPTAPKPIAKVVVDAPKTAHPVKAETPASKVSHAKSRPSLVHFPAPPAPVRPPFVPPKAAPAPAPGANGGGNGTHSPAFIQKQRQRLLDLRDELVDSMSGMTRDTIRNAPEGSEASGSGQHQGDAGSDAYDRDFALSVLAKEQDALYEIEQALRRIQAGTYGICEISARKILQTRLEVIPFARLTVECQAQWEKEYGKRRFRPSNEVGFSGGKYVEEEDSETVSLDEDED